jgi:hypothetical protein
LLGGGAQRRGVPTPKSLSAALLEEMEIETG